MVADNVVGPAGFTLQARVYDTADQPDAGANDAIEAAFARWSALGVCDVSGHSSFRDLCRMLATAAARDGEFLVRIVRGKSASNAFGIALQAIDIDRLDTKLNDAARAATRSAWASRSTSSAARSPTGCARITPATWITPPGGRRQPCARAGRRHPSPLRRRSPRAAARRALDARRHEPDEQPRRLHRSRHHRQPRRRQQDGLLHQPGWRHAPLADGTDRNGVPTPTPTPAPSAPCRRLRLQALRPGLPVGHVRRIHQGMPARHRLRPRRRLQRAGQRPRGRQLQQHPPGALAERDSWMLVQTWFIESSSARSLPNG